MPPVRDNAICIRQWDWSETSQTVSLLTQGHGVVRAVAKGSRRPLAPFSGGIELLTVAEIALLIKPTSDLANLIEWDLREHFPPLRSSLGAYHTALFAAELVQRMISDHDPHPAVYQGMLDLLRGLGPMAGRGGTHPDPPSHAGLLAFQVTLLRESGFAPVLDRDVRTDAPVGDSPIVHFVPALGGVVLAKAQAIGPDGRPAESWPVRSATLSALAGRPGATAQDVERACRLMAAYIRTLIGSSPRTMGLVFPSL